MIRKGREGLFTFETSFFFGAALGQQFGGHRRYRTGGAGQRKTERHPLDH